MPPSPKSSSSSAIDIILPAPNYPTSDIRTPLPASSQHCSLPRPMSVFSSSPSCYSTPSFLAKLVMLITFISFTFLLPILTSLSTKLPASATSDRISFNLLIQFLESLLSIISFHILYSTLSNDRHDSQCHDSPSILCSYSSELNRAFKHLIIIFVPSFIVEVVHKLVYLSKANVMIRYIGKFLSPGLNGGIGMILVLGAWAYRTRIFLVVCMVFHLTCELQILRFLGLVDMLEGEECIKDARSVFEENVRIRKELSVTSHRYGVFIIGCLLTITVRMFQHAAAGIWLHDQEDLLELRLSFGER